MKVVSNKGGKAREATISARMESVRPLPLAEMAENCKRARAPRTLAEAKAAVVATRRELMADLLLLPSKRTIQGAKLLLMLRETPPRAEPTLLKRGHVQCGRCVYCRWGDCGKCANCLDKRKFGGPGTKKQACKARRCARPAVLSSARSDAYDEGVDGEGS